MKLSSKHAGEAQPAASKKRITRKTWQRIGLMAVAVLIFVAGINVGNGRLVIGGGNDTTHLPNRLDYSSVNQVYDALKSNYNGSLSSDQLLDGMKKGLAEATKDPYTEYFTAAEAKQFSDEVNNAYSGIGAQLGQDADGNLEVIAPVKGTPADKAGLLSKDIITSINGKSTDGLSVDEAVNQIRGKAGTKVTLQIIRNKTTPQTFTITRDNFTVPSVSTKILPGNIGYMQVNSFGDDTSQLAEQAAQSFKQQQVKGIVLDLRDNPGGEVDAAVNLTSLWLPQGTMILQEKRGDTVVDESDATGKNTLQGIKTVVLVNGGSASAAEITAGALHDNKAATIIGEKTYGKGVVQQVICLGKQSLLGNSSSADSQLACSSDELKVTVASWYRPNGQNINHKGIAPDQTVKLTADDAKAGNDPQLTAAQAALSK